MNIRQNGIDQALSRDVLNILAASFEPKQGILDLLATLQNYYDIVGASFTIFEEPHEILSHGEVDPESTPDVEIQATFAQTLADQPQYQPTITLYDQRISFDNCIAVPIRPENTIDALLWIILDPETNFEFTDEKIHLLESIIQGLTVLCRMLKANAHHAKLERNQSEFISIVSHDLRSPLTSIKGFAGMLESGSVGDVNEQQVYFIQKILAGISQMTSLVDNIQDAGRYDPETGFYKMQRTHCDLTEIVARIVRNHIVPAEKQALSLHATIADNVPIVNIDTHMIERAIINLVDNAIKYTPNGGEVEVSVQVKDEQVLVSVRDTGLGISPENQVNLFERRVRIPRQEHKRIKGSGLGLFIVRSAARRHGGDAWIESEEGFGSTFYIGIPLRGENLIIPDNDTV